jgi:hypothetical protein
MGEVLRISASDPGGKGRADTGGGELREHRSLQSNLLYGCLIEAAVNLAKKHKPTVWQELLDCMSMRRLRFWFPYAYPHIHPDELNEEQRREEHRRHEANVKIWLSKKDKMISEPVWPEADKIINRLHEILFLAYRRCEITIFIVKGTGTEPLSSKVLHTEGISWCELAFPFDFAENAVKCDGQPYEVADVVNEVDNAASAPERKEATAPAPPAIVPTSPKKAASCSKIDQAMTTVFDNAERAGEKSPNLTEIIAPVQAILRAEGYEASGRQIQKLAAADQHKIRRRKIGPTVANEKRRLQRLEE